MPTFYLIGSHARGLARPQDDIDVLIGAGHAFDDQQAMINTLAPFAKSKGGKLDLWVDRGVDIEGVFTSTWIRIGSASDPITAWKRLTADLVPKSKEEILALFGL